MYLRIVLPPAREPFAGHVDSLAAVVLDADRPEVERINALHRLRGERDRRREISRRLVRALNEPLVWFGSELHWALAKMDDSLALGVDAHGMIAASPEADEVLARDDDGQRHCPTLGPVHAVAHAGALFASLASPPPWLRAPPDGGALVCIGGLRRVWLQHFGTIGGRDEATARITEIGSMLFKFRFAGGRLVFGDEDNVRAALAVGDEMETVARRRRHAATCADCMEARRSGDFRAEARRLARPGCVRREGRLLVDATLSLSEASSIIDVVNTTHGHDVDDSEDVIVMSENAYRRSLVPELRARELPGAVVVRFSARAPACSNTWEIWFRAPLHVVETRPPKDECSS